MSIAKQRAVHEGAMGHVASEGARHDPALENFLPCSALNEHLEPLYLENLRAAIAKLGRGGH